MILRRLFLSLGLLGLGCLFGFGGCASAPDGVMTLNFSVRTNTEATVSVEKVVKNLPSKFGSSTREEAVGTQVTRGKIAFFKVRLLREESESGATLRVTVAAPGYTTVQKIIGISGEDGEITVALSAAP